MRLEVVSIVSFPLVWGALAWRAFGAAEQWPLALVAALVCAPPAADVLSGLAHFAFDTRGSAATPILGRFVGPFRAHHVDPLAITRQSFFETNGNNALGAAIVGAASLLVPEPSLGPVRSFAAATIVLVALLVAVTNQIHRWAHEQDRPRLVTLLQRAHLLLSPEQHARHHVPPYVGWYCITFGWLDALGAELGRLTASGRARSALGTRPRP
jgi:hypothetical protein